VDDAPAVPDHSSLILPLRDDTHRRQSGAFEPELRPHVLPSDIIATDRATFWAVLKTFRSPSSDGMESDNAAGTSDRSSPINATWL
jgi:hypothetical protein